jgi:glycerol-3-phosphate acyltransferase PlsY
MTPTSMLLCLIPLAYLAGSTPFGLLVGLTRGVDPRTAGSRNIGATNVGRLLGGKYFAIVFTLDLLKGMLPTLLAGWALGFSATTITATLLWMLVACAAIFGHVFSVFLKFKGGKGVATSAGALLGVWPFLTIPIVLAMLVFCIVAYFTRYVSLGSILGTSSVPVFYLVIGLLCGWPVFSTQLPFLIAGIFLTSMIVYRHRGNIARLRAGTEHKIGEGVKA